MPLQDKHERLLALSDEHALALAVHVDKFDRSASELYRHIANVSTGSRRFESLRRDLAALVERARTDARNLAVAHVLAELRVIAGAGVEKLSVPMGADPTPAEVARYIDNAVAAARDVEPEEFASTAYRAHTIIESEATNQYQRGRAVANDWLRHLPDAVTEPMGFRIARDPETFRAVDNVETREADDWISLVGERWNARASACEHCRTVDGELRPFGFSFTLPGPAAHARCQCVRTLWAIAVPTNWRAHDMGDKASKQPVLGRAYSQADIEAREIDEAARIIRGVTASTEALDSHGTIIRAAGWQLDRFAKNPVLLWAHSASSRGAGVQPEDVLGTVGSTEVKGNRLITDLHFSPKGLNPKADLVFEQMRVGIIKGVSVGFMPRKYHFEKAAGSDEDTMIIDEQELVELSVVPIPSNPETLAKELRSLCSVEYAAAPPRESETMTDENKDTGLALPPEVSSLLKVETVEDAVRAIAEMNLRVDVLTQQRDQAVIERDAALTQLNERVERECQSEVDALITTGRIKKDNRDSALTLLRSAPDAFRAMYPRVDNAAPLANLLKRVVTPEQPSAPLPDGNPVVERANKLISEGVSRDEAYSRAASEYLKSKRPAI
jgi:HK97 family phage prohead protease